MTSPADPADQRKPLVLLESWPSTQIVATRLVKPPASLLALAESTPSAERCFRRLVQDGERQMAVRFLAAALRRRVQVWWGYPEQWLDRFLELGVEVAQGVRTWDELLRERQSGPHPWAGRAGFGRQVAKPEPPRPG